MARNIEEARAKIKTLKGIVSRYCLRIDEYRKKKYEIQYNMGLKRTEATTLKKQGQKRRCKILKRELAELSKKTRYIDRMIEMFSMEKRKYELSLRRLVLSIKVRSGGDDAYSAESTLNYAVNSPLPPDEFQKYLASVAKYTPGRTPSDVESYGDK